MSRDKSEQWLTEAANDLEVAEILLKAKKYNASVFHSQQSAEKSIKGLLYSLNVQPWGHSVAKLIEEYQKIEVELPEKIMQTARTFDRHYTTSRYPDVLPDLTPMEAYDEDIAQEMYEKAEYFYKYLTEQNQKQKKENLEEGGNNESKE